MPFNEPSVSSSTSERDVAAQASRGCPDCNGNGLVTVFHPLWRGHAIEVTRDGRRYAAIGAAHCSCPLGVWTRDHVPPEIQARIPRVEDIREGRSKWLLEPPGEDHGVSGGSVTQADFDEFWCMIEAGHMLKHPDVNAPPRQTAWTIETSFRQRLVAKLGLDPRVAEVLTLAELHEIETLKGGIA